MVNFSKRIKTNTAIHDIFGSTGDRKTSYESIVVHDSNDILDGLNSDQSAMVLGMVNYLKNRDREFFLVQGGGGTGKSFSVNRALSTIDPKYVLAAAPSHFAKNVLQDFLGDQYRVTTVAAMLGKKVSYDDNGDQILVPIRGKTPPIMDYKVILIDEGSMIDDEVYEEVLNYVREGNRYLIVLGDYCQLPPVGQNTDSKFFDNVAAELTIPMRFTGPIYQMASLVRNEIIKIRQGLVPTFNVINIETGRKSLLTDEGSGVIFLNNHTAMVNAAIRRFKQGRGVGYVRLLAYRNKTIDKLNLQVRLGLFGENSLQFEDGELLINEGGFSVNNKQVITNGQLFEVEHATPVVGPYDIPCVSLTFRGKTFETPILVLSTEGKILYDKILKRLKKIANNDKRYWKDVIIFKESFAYFNYSYATSIHKSQGSSINHVFILEDDVLAVKLTSTKAKLQSMYVAISRATYRAYLYNKGYKIDSSGLTKEKLMNDC